jgi:hypothetical protein
MSDGSKAKRLKITVKDPGSLSSNTLTPQGGSRAASPKPQAPTPGEAKAERFPTLEEIRAAIPPGGITIKDFVTRVSHPKERRTELITLIRSVANIDKETKLLRLK